MSQTVIRLSFPKAQPSWHDRLSRLWTRIDAAWRDAEARRQLAMLDDRALSDIGISRAQAQFEAERPVWELVPHLHR